MADAFISYARADRLIAQALASRLQEEGRTVWWDADATPGQSFRDEISRQLDLATTVIVIWTPTSVKSQWVISEAQRASTKGKLVPLRTCDLDVSAIPQPFDTLHTPTLDENIQPLTKAGRNMHAQWLDRVLFRIWLVAAIIWAISGVVVLQPHYTNIINFYQGAILDEAGEIVSWELTDPKVADAHRAGFVRASPGGHLVRLSFSTIMKGDILSRQQLAHVDIVIERKASAWYWEAAGIYYAIWAICAPLLFLGGWGLLNLVRWIFATR